MKNADIDTVKFVYLKLVSSLPQCVGKGSRVTGSVFVVLLVNGLVPGARRVSRACGNV